MRPLHLLTSGENVPKDKKMIDWNEESQQSFDKLKDLYTNTPVLTFTDYNKALKYTQMPVAWIWGLCCIRLKGMDLLE